MDSLLGETPLLDYNNLKIQEFILENNFQAMDDKKKINKLYDYVRNDIRFGYNKTNKMCASEVFKEKQGDNITKSILLMSLLRAVNIPNRIHAYTIDKKLLGGLINNVVYDMCPEEIIYFCIEVLVNDKWICLNDITVDKVYYEKLKFKFKDKEGVFCGYGICTDDINNLSFDAESTYFIHQECIIKDLGIFKDPDSFWKSEKKYTFAMNKRICKYIYRIMVNNNIKKIRNLYYEGLE